MFDNTNIQTVMVIGAHPDDEILGVGGTVRKLVLSGSQVISVITAFGRKELQQAIKPFSLLANQCLGVTETLFLDYPNLEMEMFPLHEITKRIEELFAKYRPNLVLTHHYGDLNRDHQITFQAVMTAARPMPNQAPIDILCFETVSSSEWAESTGEKLFKPNYYVDISETIGDKLDALIHYDLEMRPFPHPRSFEGIKHLAFVRGMSVGVTHAEAFEIIRRVWK